MEPDMILEEGLKRLGLKSTFDQRLQFLEYLHLLMAWNERINLTAITDIREIVIYHFFDSLSLLKITKIKEDAKILDLGSGAGFPGLPLKILCPKLRLVLIDSVRKKTDFLKAAADELSLQGVEVMHKRAEEAARLPDMRETFDIVVSRAVAALPTLTEYCMPFVRIGGWFAAYKGPAAQEEAASAAAALSAMGGSNPRIEKVTVPYSDKTHQIIIVEKLRQTPKQYPRTGDKPRKIPL